jgi:O-antigen/teichoic acid export membrane protein
MFVHHHYGYGGGMTDWMEHIAISAVIHGLIYALIFKVMHQLALAQVVPLVIAVLALMFMWGRARDRRGWYRWKSSSHRSHSGQVGS